MRLATALSLALMLTLAGLYAEETPVPSGLGPLDMLAPPPKTQDGLPPAEVIEIPVRAPTSKESAKREPKSPSGAPATAPKYKENPGAALALQPSPVPGFKSLLCGELDQDLAIGPEHSPVLVRGACIVPAGRTLTLKAGAVLQLQPDPNLSPADKPGQPDPSKAGQLWVVGKLVAQGQAGKPAALSGANAAQGSQSGLFFYGQERSELEGVKLTDVAVTQSGQGEVLWTACEILNARHYALAAGAAVFEHTSFRRCGGLFAAYANGPWALMAMRCSIEQCREGLVIGSDPGEECLVFRNNTLTGTQGANLRAAPAHPARLDARGRPVTTELLIGENWFGIAEPEVVDAKIVDVRSDPKIAMRLNTRPPEPQAYAHTGANVPAEVLAKSLKELEPVRIRLLAAYEKKLAPKTAQKP
ncbi:MAG: hypothetical protein HY291_14390 [Planctomycetes bacterium]|nr:hypothetical protein [Planctomycetota bacterium]